MVSHSSPKFLVGDFLDSFLEMKFEREAEFDKMHCTFYAKDKVPNLSDALQVLAHLHFRTMEQQTKIPVAHRPTHNAL